MSSLEDSLEASGRLKFPILGDSQYLVSPAGATIFAMAFDLGGKSTDDGEGILFRHLKCRPRDAYMEDISCECGLKVSVSSSIAEGYSHISAQRTTLFQNHVPTL